MSKRILLFSCLVVAILSVSIILAINAKPQKVIDIENSIEKIEEFDSIKDGYKLISIRESINKIGKDASKIDNIDILENAEKKYEMLCQEEVDSIMKLIDDIGAVNKNSEKQIRYARNKYDNTEEEVKKGIANIDILVKAENDFEQLKKKAFVACSSCGGSGGFKCSKCKGIGRETCIECKGGGSVKYYYGASDFEAYLDGYDPYTFGKCTLCNGSGKYTCNSCRGDGKTKCTSCNGDGGRYDWSLVE